MLVPWCHYNRRLHRCSERDANVYAWHMLRLLTCAHLRTPSLHSSIPSVTCLWKKRFRHHGSICRHLDVEDQWRLWKFPDTRSVRMDGKESSSSFVSCGQVEAYRWRQRTSSRCLAPFALISTVSILNHVFVRCLVSFLAFMLTCTILRWRRTLSERCSINILFNKWGKNKRLFFFKELSEWIAESTWWFFLYQRSLDSLTMTCLQSFTIETSAEWKAAY